MPYEITVAGRIFMDTGANYKGNLAPEVLRLAEEFQSVINEYNTFRSYLDKNIPPGKVHDELVQHCEQVSKALGLGTYREAGRDEALIEKLKTKAPASSMSAITAAMSKSRYTDPEYAKLKDMMKKKGLIFSEDENKVIYEAYRAVRDKAPFFGCGSDEENSETPMKITEELLGHRDAFIKLGGFEYFTLLIVVPASQLGICTRPDLPIIAEKWKENAKMWTTSLFHRTFSEHKGRTAAENKIVAEEKFNLLTEAHPYAQKIYAKFSKTQQAPAQPTVQEAPVQQAPVQQTTDQQAGTQQPAAQQTTDQQGAAQQAPVQQTPNQQAGTQQPAAQQTTDQQGAAQQPQVQQTPGQQPQTQQPAAQQPQVQQTPEQQPQTQQPAVQQTPEQQQQPQAQQPATQQAQAQER